MAGGLTLLGAAGLAALQLMLGVDVPVSLLVLREILLKGLWAVLLALPVYPLLRRVLRPALVDEPCAGGASPARSFRALPPRPARHEPAHADWRRAG